MVASTIEMKQKYFNYIKSKTADLEHIIEQLFLFSKLDMDEFPLDLRHVDITRVIINIVEDDQTIAAIEKDFLELNGFEVITAKDG